MKKYEREIRALIIKAERSLRAAKSLLRSGDYDFGVSRAYYAMFYCTEALLLTKDLRFSKHSAVIAYFGKEFVKEGLLSEELHKYLVKGFRERQKGDYEVITMPNRDEAEDLVDKAEIFLNETKDYLINIGYYL
ncbi:MAG: Uncharacterized protein XD62_0844 [Methanosarcinales archeaon 56_1174]|uniref:HEPN domain-containing protein n=1 Tax=Methermicoccus shengliensis TaxID=660064 RepID=UPI0005B2D535|nr:HEPN domain-containing protein [Methermicoccus shengliensis]KUK04269.1 MAG: Uncharacterized protein XD46_0994 [Euryarchaeota archaeon 55_53]KUK30058.1 MAG: Uncharacterized protein XD62_0844 [Methanosarcinales archeaon 56_1174]MDN5295145.1 hypothetical protein [Methanosarcinales archaeon]